MFVDIYPQLVGFGTYPFGSILKGRAQFGNRFVDWGDEVNEDRVPLNNLANKTPTEIKFLPHPLYDGCKEPYQEFNADYHNKYGSPIIIVDNGECHSFTKAQLALKYGKMLIIIDNDKGLRSDIKSYQDSKILSIPVLLIKKKEGEELKEFLFKDMASRTVNSNTHVMLEVSFIHPYQLEFIPRVSFWMPPNRNSYLVLLNHQQFLSELIEADRIQFSVNISFSKCDQQCKEMNEIDGSSIKDSCINNGEICHFDPDGSGPMRGVDSILQAATQLCINLHFPKLLFSYIIGYAECIHQEESKLNVSLCNDAAVEKLIKMQPAVDQEAFKINVDYCKKSSMDLSSTLLPDKNNHFLASQLSFLPALTSNDILYTGSLFSQSGVKQFVCLTTFNDQDMPVCQANPYQNIKDLEKIIIDEIPRSANSGISASILIVVIVILLIAFAFMVFICRRKVQSELRKELELQVDSAVLRYTAFKDKQGAS